ncbi:MAG: NUDIX hydrolase [Candidatus Micrarchaeia archaeon]
MRPATADAVVIHAGSVLLVRRARPPFAGRWALPGGFVDEGETAEQAAARECLEETGVRVRAARLIGVYSSPARDPRKTVTAAFLCRPAGPLEPRGGDDAAAARWFPLVRLPPLAFDHREILADAIRLSRKRR